MTIPKTILLKRVETVQTSQPVDVNALHTWDNQFPADARILNLLFTFSFRKSEVITDVYTHLLKQETLCRLIENLTVTFSDLGGKFANTDRQKSLFCRICSIRNNNFVACTCFQVVNFNKKKKKSKRMIFGKLSRTSGNKR